MACYLPVVLVPYLNTGNFWYVALLGLIFPLTFFALLFFVVLWAAARSKWFWASFIILAAGLQQVNVAFGLNSPKDFASNKPSGSLRILQWNVTSWDDNTHSKDPTPKYRAAMLDLVKKQNADILCFQEFFEPLENLPNSPNIAPIVKMGFPYYYFVSSFSWKRDFKNGIIIFSRFPIIDSAKFDFSDDPEAEHLLYADVKIKDKILRVFTTHLQSVRFNEKDYQSLSKIKRRNEEGLKDSKSIVKKLKSGYALRYSQAQLVNREIQSSPYPTIVCGDFNDVPNSNTYFTIKDDLQDTFLKAGFFMGRTFRFISPTLRIDYILADKRFPVLQTRIIHVPYSDHYPVVTDLAY